MRGINACCACMHVLRSLTTSIVTDDIGPIEFNRPWPRRRQIICMIIPYAAAGQLHLQAGLRMRARKYLRARAALRAPHMN